MGIQLWGIPLAPVAVIMSGHSSVTGFPSYLPSSTWLPDPPVLSRVRLLEGIPYERLHGVSQAYLTMDSPSDWV